MTAAESVQESWIGVVPEALRIPAAERIVGGSGLGQRQAAERLIQTAGDHGIDLDLFFGFGIGSDVRQACLFVPSAGRTAMVFLSGEGDERRLGTSRVQIEDRVRVLDAGLGVLRAHRSADVTLLQALLDPTERWAIATCEAWGMTRVGGLAYLRRSMPKPPKDPIDPRIAEDVWLRPIRSLDIGEDRELLARALEVSYIDTLDCPELCGRRSTDDVIESHRATGEFDPSTWWLVMHDDEPAGCVLMSHAPAHGTVELVYIGIGPQLRGRRLGGKLLDAAIAGASKHRAAELTCAVDRRNVPAMTLYASRGFSEFTSREAFIRSVAD